MKVEDVERSDQKMNKDEAAKFRKGAAILNNLSQDRVDMSYASKEVSRFMADPRVGDEVALVRAIKYLARYPRYPSYRADSIHGLRLGRVYPYPTEYVWRSHDVWKSSYPTLVKNPTDCGTLERGGRA